MKHLVQFAVQLKRLLIFVGSIAIVLLIYRILLPNELRTSNILASVALIWFFTAYVVLPRAHRLLSRLYVPDHFIGRVRTSDGLLSDPINIALNGERHDLILAMQAAGWRRAEKLSPVSIWRTIIANVFRRSYPNAPVSDAFLFGRKQSLAFQKEVDNNPHQRHHVRFWHTPSKFYLPGGHKADWLGAATYDTAVSFSFFTSQFTHKIDAKVDKERDFVIETLQQAKMVTKVNKVEHFFPSYRSRNGFGHFFFTDGAMVLANLKATESENKRERK